MSDQFNEDLLKEALDFDLDDYAIDNLVAGLADENQGEDIEGYKIEQEFVDMDNIPVNTAHLLQHNEQIADIPDVLEEYTESNHQLEDSSQSGVIENMLEEQLMMGLISQQPGRGQDEREHEQGIVQELKQTLVGDSQMDLESLNHENDLAIERLMSKNPEMFEKPDQDKIDPLDRFQTSATEQAYDYGISSDLNLDLDLNGLDNLDLDIDFEAVLRGDPIVIKSQSVNKQEDATAERGEHQLDYSENSQELSSIIDAFQRDSEFGGQDLFTQVAPPIIPQEELFDIKLPRLQFGDDIIRSMRKDFGLSELEVNKIIDKRFGNLQQVEQDLNPNRQIQAFQPGQRQLSGKPLSDDVINLATLLEKYEQVQSNQIKAIKKDRSELRENYFSSLQQGEWSASSDVSPIEVIKHKTISELLTQNDSVKLTSFALSIFSQKLFLAGTNTGEIIECDLTSSKIKRYQLTSEVMTVDICRDDSMWAAGTSKSEIMVRKSLGGWAKKVINDFNSRPIIQIRFVNKNCMLVATDRTVTKFKLTDMKLTYEIKFEPVTYEQAEIVQIMFMPLPDIPNNAVVLTASMNKVEFSLLDPTPRVVSHIPRPDYIEQGWQPVVSWMIHVEKSFCYVIIFWKDFIFLVKNDQDEFVLCGQKQMQKNMIWGTVLSNRIVCYVDEEYNMELRSVEYLFASFASGGGFGGSHQLPKDRMVDTRVICTRADGSLTKSPHERVRALGNSVGFLTKDGLVKARLLSIKELVEIYIDKGKWLPALRLCVEVFKGKIVATKQEKDEIQSHVPQYATSYVKNFLKGDKDNKKLMASVARVSIEVMIETSNTPQIFNTISQLIDSIVFWKEIESMILNGKILLIPGHAIEKGSVYLNKEAIQILMLNININELLAQDEDFHQIVQIVKKRRLWESFIYIALNAPEISLKLFLSSVMQEQLTLSKEETSKMQQFLKEKKHIDLYIGKVLDAGAEDSTVNVESEIGQDPKNIDKFMQIFYWIWKIVNWKQLNNLVSSEESLFEIKLRNYEVLLEWIFEEKNLDGLSRASMELLVEIFFDIFMNHEIILIHEAKFKPLVINYWRLFLLKNSYLETFLQTAYPYFPKDKKVAPSQTHQESHQLPLTTSTGSIQNLDMLSLEKRDSVGSIRSTEGTEPSTYNKQDSEESASTENEETVQYLEDTRLSKLILMLIELQFYHHRDRKRTSENVNYSFFFIRLLNMSMFNHLCKDKEWVKNHLNVVMSEEFRSEKFWMYYHRAQKSDVEEQIVRVFKMVEFDWMTLDEFISKAQETVFAYLVDIKKGPIEGLKIHMKNAMKPESGEDHYIFNWLTNQFEQMKKNSREVGIFSEEILVYLPDLIKLNKKKAKDLILKLPSIESNFEAIKILECFPDLQMQFIENLLEKEQEDKDLNISKELRIQFLKLKCRFEPESIVKILKLYKFPLDESLKICKELKLKHAVAHINFRQGLTEEAIDEYLNIIRDSLKAYLAPAISSEESKRHISDAQFSFKTVIEICEQMTKNDTEGARIYFDRFLNFVIENYFLLGSQDYYTEANLESQVKVYELSCYIKNTFIEKVFVSYVKALGSNEIIRLMQENKHMRSLKLKDYRGLIQFLSFERKTMDDIDFVSKLGQKEIKEQLHCVKSKGGVKSFKCCISNEKVGNDALLFYGCSHPVQINQAKNLYDNTKDIKCHRCSEKHTIEKALLSKIYKVDSMSLEELEKQSAEINSTSGRSNKSKDIEQGFLNSSILEDNLNRTYLRIYSDTTQDDILDEAEENDKLSSFKLRFL